MGVPKFFRWLSERYPLVCQTVDPVQMKPEFDYLYLDMNGIIHNCTHGDGLTRSMSEADIMAKVFQYIDKLFNTVVPQKVFFMAIDGVAPRAKMNQQRSRRFRSAHDAKEQLLAMERKGLEVPDDMFDSNCITPGTEFMAKLNVHLAYYVRKKIKEDVRWREIQVIYSGHDVPGEGEHKIMDYIRGLKNEPGYNPNERHCMYGLDADLMFLSMMTHEPHFALLREVVKFGGRVGHNSDKAAVQAQDTDKFILLHISLLREYLAIEYNQVFVNPPASVAPPNFEFDAERIVDDFIAMCMFMGNDFLPHLPTLDIGDGGLDNLIQVYKDSLGLMGGYLIDQGKLNLERAEMLFKQTGQLEATVFVSRAAEKDKFAKRSRRGKPADLDEDDIAEKEFIAELKGLLSSGDESDAQLAVKMYYYQEKFASDLEARGNDSALLTRDIRQSYMEGLQWVLEYYYKGCASWDWFYPFYYAPLCSDLTNLGECYVDFPTNTVPFTPLQQLLSVLPPESSPFLPPAYSRLMKEPSSPILDFFPNTISIDMNGKRNPWEGIVLIPFINSKRLIDAVQSINPATLTASEQARNVSGGVMRFVYNPNALDTARSSLSNFPDLHQCQSATDVYTMPNQDGFVAKLCPGVTMPLAGYPWLQALKFSSKLAKAEVNVHGSASKKPSLILQIKERPDKPGSDLLLSSCKLLKKIVYVNAPFCQPALVTGVSDESRRASGDGKEPDMHKMSPQESESWVAEGVHIAQMNLTTKGIQILPPRIMVSVRPFSHLSRSSKGGLQQVFLSKAINVPLSLIAMRPPPADPRCQPQAARPIHVDFPVGSKTVYLGSGPSDPDFGCEAVVHGHGEDRTLDLTVLRVPNPPFGFDIVSRSNEQFLPSYVVAKQLKMPTAVLNKVTGMLFVNLANGDDFNNRLNIGLNLKASSRNMVVAGYCKRLESGGGSSSGAWSGDGRGGGGGGGGGGTWCFSPAAIAVVQSYRAAFPRLFSQIQALGDEKSYQSGQLFPAEADPDAAVARVGAWLDAQECTHMPLVPASSEVVSRAGVIALEKCVDEYIQSLKTQGGIEEMQHAAVNTKATFSPPQPGVLSQLPSQGQIPPLGARVVCLKSGGSVPFGVRGTVIALYGDGLAELLLDNFIAGGNTLHGRCAQGRGTVMHADFLLLLTPKKSQASKSQSSKGQASKGKGKQVAAAPAAPAPAAPGASLLHLIRPASQ